MDLDRSCFQTLGFMLFDLQYSFPYPFKLFWRYLKAPLFIPWQCAVRARVERWECLQLHAVSLTVVVWVRETVFPKSILQQVFKILNFAWWFFGVCWKRRYDTVWKDRYIYKSKCLQICQNPILMTQRCFYFFFSFSVLFRLANKKLFLL